MKRLALIAAVALPLLTVSTVSLLADAKTKTQSTLKFEGMLGRMFSMFGGKAAKEGTVTTVAVKGNRRATTTDIAGEIVDLSEEKVYRLDPKKKEYYVVTFDQMREEMRKAQEEAKKAQEKEEPTEKGEPQKPQKEYEVDWDVKETGQKKQVAGYDTKQTIVTITVREKGKKLEEGGGIVMTQDLWLGPRLPEVKELADFEIKYWKQLRQGAGIEAMSPTQLAQLMAMFPLVSKAFERASKDADKLAGTPLDTTMTIEGVKSPEQMTQAQESGNSGGGGLGGMLARKMIKKEPPKQRSLIMTLHTQVLEVGKAVEAADLAVPADFKEKKK
jgi:hypothetical protein